MTSKKSYLKAPDTDFYQFSLARYFFRPISFPLSFALIKMGFSPNQVTFVSWFFVLVGCISYTLGSTLGYSIGFAFIIIWAILDYVDGSMARFLKKRTPFGHYIDVVGAYFVIGFLPLCISIGLAGSAGLSANEQKLYLILGSLSSIFAVMLRLILTKGETIFKFNARDAMETRSSLATSVAKWVEALMSPRGIYFPLLFASSFGPANALKYFIILYFVYNIISSIGYFLLYIRRCYKIQVAD